MFKKNNQNEIDLSNQDFEKIKKQALIIDVRDEAEVATLRKMPNAINIPYKKLIANPQEFIKNKQQIIVTVCNAGHRSTAAAMSLREQGYENAFVLTTGIYGYPK